MAPTPPIPLPLRNALAALALRALGDPAARDAVAWLAAPAGSPDEAAARALVAVGLADPPGARLLEMYEAHEAHVRRHAERAAAALRALDAAPPSADPIEGALAAAAALWRARLFFEVHEVLEPHWGRASGATREALQGLIQVAVAFHHLAHGNRRGARKLLVDGREKLAATRDALPTVDVGALLAATEPWLAALGADAAPPDEAAPPLVLRHRDARR